MIGHKTKCTCALGDDATLRRASSALYDIADAFGLDQDEWTEMCDKFWTVATGSTGET